VLQLIQRNVFNNSSADPLHAAFQRIAKATALRCYAAGILMPVIVADNSKWWAYTMPICQASSR
jgi:hypothetical protein